MKKRLSLVTAIIILFCFVFSFCAHADEKSENYLIFGDSITTGYGLADKSGRYSTIVSEKLGAAEYNYGVDGATSADLLAKITGSNEIKEAISGASFISVSIGGNDLLDKYKYILPQAIGLSTTDSSAEIEATYTSFQSNLTQIIALIRQYNTTCKIYVQTLYNPYGSLTVMERYNAGTLLDPYIVKLNNIIRTLANDGSFTVTDVAWALNGNAACFSTASNISAQDFFDLMSGRLDYKKFDFHPSAVGHAEIAKLLEAQIASEYPQSSESKDSATTATVATTSETASATTPATTAATASPASTATTETTPSSSMSTSFSETTEESYPETTTTTWVLTCAQTGSGIPDTSDSSTSPAVITSPSESIATTIATMTSATVTTATASSTSAPSEESTGSFVKTVLPIIAIAIVLCGIYAVYAIKKKH